MSAYLCHQEEARRQILESQLPTSSDSVEVESGLNVSHAPGWNGVNKRRLHGLGINKGNDSIFGITDGELQRELHGLSDERGSVHAVDLSDMAKIGVIEAVELISPIPLITASPKRGRVFAQERYILGTSWQPLTVSSAFTIVVAVRERPRYLVGSCDRLPVHCASP